MAMDRPSFDRVPPQNLEAEQAVLGSMLIERAAVEKAAEILKPDDFYRDAHRYIFEAMLALTERDEPCDMLTVSDELNMRGHFEIAGGRIYLVNLMEAPATAANIEYYARMVEEKAILRKLMDVGTQIQGLAYSEFDVIGDVVDRAERLVFEVGQQRMGQFFYHLRPLLDEELDRIEKRYENRDNTAAGGRKTPFDDLNYKTNGLNPSDLIILAARPGMGKCLPAYTLIDNPLTGARQTLAECVEQRLPVVYGMASSGEIRQTAVSDWIDSGIQPTYRVRTRTGRSVDVTGHHPFLTVQGWTPLHCLKPGRKIGVPRAVVCFGQDEYAPGLVRLMAYFVAERGLSGTSPRFTNTDPVLVADFKAIIAEHFAECAIRQYGIDYAVVKSQRSNRANPVTAWLHDLGLMGKKADAKRLPMCVWRWKREHLAELLRVLFSCDGTIYNMAGCARIEFAVASEPLASDVHHALTRFGIVGKFWRKSERCWRVEITESASVARYQNSIGWLGEKATRAYRITEGETRRSIVGHPPQEVWAIVRAEAARCGLSLSELARRSGESSAGKNGYNPHTNRSLPRRRLAQYADVLDSPRLRMLAHSDLYWDEIVSIEALGAQQVYDLTVPDGANFIAQDVCVHNTSLAVQIAQHVAMNEQVPVAIFSLEMSKEQLVTRMICSESKVDSNRLRNGSLLGDDWQRVGEGISRLAEAPIYIDDSPDISAMEMRTKCRRLKAEKEGLGMIVIDYLQLMRSHKKTDNRTQEISEIARACKQLARELKVPVIALSQLSRAVESRPDKRPMLSDLRECVIGDTRLTDARTGRQVAIRDVQAGDCIVGMGRDQKLGAYEVQDVWSTGVKPVWTLTTRTGRQVTASANHPFLTAQGWKRVEELQPGDIIATAAPLSGLDPEAIARTLIGSDLFCDPLVSIEAAGEQETFDIKVECANFLANGIVAHNSGSIEAEADIVMFIYRDSYYKMKEGGQDGEQAQDNRDNSQAIDETELILAKHRSGPTGKVFVGFMPQYTRFENLTDRQPGDMDE